MASFLMPMQKTLHDVYLMQVLVVDCVPNFPGAELRTALGRRTLRMRSGMVALIQLARVAAPATHATHARVLQLASRRTRAARCGVAPPGALARRRRVRWPGPTRGIPLSRWRWYHATSSLLFCQKRGENLSGGG
jgi:hypothetical protein